MIAAESETTTDRSGRSGRGLALRDITGPDSEAGYSKSLMPQSSVMQGEMRF